MGQIFKNPTVPQHRASYGQRRYLAAKKSNRETKNVKHEQSMQIKAAEWTRKTFPGIHFMSDTGSGAFNSEWAKTTHSQQQSDKGLPDMTIFAARRGFHGLCPELKPEDTELKMRRDGRKARVYKNSRGKIIGRDLAPRKKGDWKDMFIERQHQRHVELRQEGYCATFVIGLEGYKKLVCWYFDVPYIAPLENAELTF